MTKWVLKQFGKGFIETFGALTAIGVIAYFGKGSYLQVGKTPTEDKSETKNITEESEDEEA